VSDFVARLDGDWIKLAEYMGYDQELIRHIDNIHPRWIAGQQNLFLRLWRMPDLGVHKTASILEKIRKSARLCESFQKIPRGIGNLKKHSSHYVFETMKEDTIIYIRELKFQVLGYLQNFFISTRGRRGH